MPKPKRAQQKKKPLLKIKFFQKRRRLHQLAAKTTMAEREPMLADAVYSNDPEKLKRAVEKSKQIIERRKKEIKRRAKAIRKGRKRNKPKK